MKRSVSWLGGAFVVLLTGCLDSPTEPSFLLAVQGTAYRGGTPVPGARVAIWDVPGDPAFITPTLVATTTADAQGRYYLGPRVTKCGTLQIKADIDDPTVWSLSTATGQIVCTEETQTIDIDLPQPVGVRAPAVARYACAVRPSGDPMRSAYAGAASSWICS